MRISLASAFAAIVCLGCNSGGTSAGSGGSGGGQASGGTVGSAEGGSTGTGGHASGGTSGGATGGTSGGATGGTSGGATGGASGGTSGGASGGTSGGATGGTAGHGSGGTAGHGSGGAGGHASGGAAGHGTGGAAGHPAAGAGGAATGSGGTTRDAGTTVNDGGIGQNGNPNGSCSGGVPSGGQPVDVSSPTTVVGTGTAASCTFSALSAAVTKAGIITFNCGSAAVTIPVTATLNVSPSKNTVIDGGNKVTLDGGHAVGIMLLNGSSFQVSETRLTLQHLALVNGKTTPSMPFPTAPLPCSQGYYDGQGGAVHVNDGNLTVIDCLFDGNQAAQLGPDTGGGAIYIEGSKHGALIVGSTFTNNNGANAGGVGALFGELDIYNSLFQNNKAVGHDANNNDSSMCSINNNDGQHEIGSGGNGGAIYGDGNNFNITLCGDAVLNNAAGVNAFGGGLFFTSDNSTGVLTIIDTTMTGNTGGSWTVVSTGSVTNVGSAIGVTAKSITVTNSTLQK
jgi:hypothetical protein